jgi:dTDP-4-dehydrorhamnose reductase
MKIMITGARGQLGADSVRVLNEIHEVVAVDHEELDITRLSDVETMVKDFTPDIILNCAAYTQVDNCETDKEPAWKINVTGTKNLAQSVAKHGGRLIHISTDYVFDGGKKVPEPYLEEDEPHPLSYYGMTKYESEKVVRQTTERHMIIRTAWLYGVNGHNFLKTILKLALNNPNNKIKVVNDQFGSPTWAHRLVLQIARIIDENGQGTYHATAEGYCTWYELANYFLKKMEVPHTVIPCTSEEYPKPAPRPKNSILENRHLKKKGINIMQNWQDDLDQFVDDFKERLLSEISKEQ